MNMVPDKPLYEVLFSRECKGFNGEAFVYTEDVIGSNPISPTIFSNAFSQIYEVTGRCM